MSNLNEVDVENATVVLVKPGEEDPEGDVSEDFTLVINNQWDGMGLAITSSNKEGFEDFLAMVKEAIRSIPDHE